MPVQAKPTAPGAPAIKASGAPKSAATVTVACKIPTGLILQMCQETEFWEDTPSGARVRKRWDRAGARVVLRGPAYPVGQAPKQFRPPPNLEEGYALTTGVPADFWDEWVEQNKRNPLVINRMVFAHARTADARAEAQELKAVRSGLEPLNMEGDPRMPRPMSGVGPVEPADEMAHRSGAPAQEFVE